MPLGTRRVSRRCHRGEVVPARQLGGDDARNRSLAAFPRGLSASCARHDAGAFAAKTPQQRDPFSPDLLSSPSPSPPPWSVARLSPTVSSRQRPSTGWASPCSPRPRRKALGRPGLSPRHFSPFSGDEGDVLPGATNGGLEVSVSGIRLDGLDPTDQGRLTYTRYPYPPHPQPLPKAASLRSLSPWTSFVLLTSVLFSRVSLGATPLQTCALACWGRDRSPGKSKGTASGLPPAPFHATRALHGRAFCP